MISCCAAEIEGVKQKFLRKFQPDRPGRCRSHHRGQLQFRPQCDNRDARPSHAPQRAPGNADCRRGEKASMLCQARTYRK